MEGKSTTEEANLVDALIVKCEGAIDDRLNRKFDAANEKMRESIDQIKSTDLEISATLLKGYSDYIENTPGELKFRDVTVEENIDRRNYREADYIGYKDGDKASSIGYSSEENNVMYDWGSTTLINDRARVYKGGSWRDRIYYTIPGTRRFLDERQSTATIGFRCAMDRVGSPQGITDF